ncbi:hypothetical protein FIV42_28730 [Persicimonas caeni]|uniref:Thiol:disulfide interchange protein DsbD N-terminal domain-containing protein n=1 Tax=Persicimonas caeni TaxID=2292766 RepID=A0A4Y6Q340_PERCE|nr:hypothetical protein [Persicimonas caeni]QDG54587.1 hypothetical protein FIV42_28730 [Persicimonas caeni]QED35808.1 hypothetical protein FRD00_28725 [Persicimonas caeni]
MIVTGCILVTALVVGCEESPQPERATAVQANAEVARNYHEDKWNERSAQEPVPVGKKAKVELAVTPDGEFKINDEFSWKIEFADSPDVQLAQKTVTSDQIEFSEMEATFPLLLEAKAAGVHKLEATGNFSVCRDTLCVPIMEAPLSFEIEAAGAAPAAEAGEQEKAGEQEEAGEQQEQKAQEQ